MGGIPGILIMTSETQEKIDKIREFSEREENWPAPDLPPETFPLGDPDHSLIIPVGFSVVYSIGLIIIKETGEQIPLKHMTVSLLDIPAWPSREGVATIAVAFGFDMTRTELSPTSPGVVMILSTLRAEDDEKIFV